MAVIRELATYPEEVRAAAEQRWFGLQIAQEDREGLRVSRHPQPVDVRRPWELAIASAGGGEGLRARRRTGITTAPRSAVSDR
jgi:hypothetical protein